MKYPKDHGADAVLPKPFNVDALNSIISAFRARDQVVKFEMPVRALNLQSLHVLVADNLTSSRLDMFALIYFSIEDINMHMDPFSLFSTAEFINDFVDVHVFNFPICSAGK